MSFRWPVQRQCSHAPTVGSTAGFFRCGQRLEIVAGNRLDPECLQERCKHSVLSSGEAEVRAGRAPKTCIDADWGLSMARASQPAGQTAVCRRRLGGGCGRPPSHHKRRRRPCGPRSSSAHQGGADPPFVRSAWRRVCSARCVKCQAAARRQRGLVARIVGPIAPNFAALRRVSSNADCAYVSTRSPWVMLVYARWTSRRVFTREQRAGDSAGPDVDPFAGVF